VESSGVITDGQGQKTILQSTGNVRMQHVSSEKTGDKKE